MGLRRDGEALLLDLKVRPGARGSAWRGRLGDCLKLDVAAAPESGRANAAVLAFVARSFGVAGADVELLAGGRGRRKRVRVGGDWRLPPELAGEHIS